MPDCCLLVKVEAHRHGWPRALHMRACATRQRLPTLTALAASDHIEYEAWVGEHGDMAAVNVDGWSRLSGSPRNAPGRNGRGSPPHLAVARPVGRRPWAKSMLGLLCGYMLILSVVPVKSSRSLSRPSCSARTCTMASRA